MTSIISILLIITAIYLTAGLAFAVVFVFRGVTKVDETAQGSGIGFRLIILPGTVVFWPLLLKKWMLTRNAVTNHNRKPV